MHIVLSIGKQQVSGLPGTDVIGATLAHYRVTTGVILFRGTT